MNDHVIETNFNSTNFGAFIRINRARKLISINLIQKRALGSLYYIVVNNAL